MSAADIAQVIILTLAIYLAGYYGARHGAVKTLEALSKHGLEIHARNAIVKFTDADDASG